MTIRIQKANEYELHVYFSYTEERVGKIREIKGRKWDREKKCWIVPNTDKTMGHLKGIFSQEKIIYSPSLENHAQSAPSTFI